MWEKNLGLIKLDVWKWKRDYVFVKLGDEFRKGSYKVLFECGLWGSVWRIWLKEKDNLFVILSDK